MRLNAHPISLLREILHNPFLRNIKKNEKEKNEKEKKRKKKTRGKEMEMKSNLIDRGEQ